MDQALVSPSILQHKLAQLAKFLEEASLLARELSQTTASATTFKPSIPELKRPAYVPPDEEWFWTEEWQAGEREVNEALQRGEYKVFNSVEELLAELHSQV